VADNQPDRNFTPTAPRPVWTSDTTDLGTNEGWFYLAIVTALCDQEIVGAGR